MGTVPARILQNALHDAVSDDSHTYELFRAHFAQFRRRDGVHRFCEKLALEVTTQQFINRIRILKPKAERATGKTVLR